MDEQPDAPTPAQGPSLEESARAELKTLRGLEAGTLTADLSCESVLKWWKRWESSYPLLARAARVLFGAAASAAALERDFSDAGQHGGLRVPRSMLRGLLLFQVGYRACLKRRVGARVLAWTLHSRLCCSMLPRVVLLFWFCGDTATTHRASADNKQRRVSSVAAVALR